MQNKPEFEAYGQAVATLLELGWFSGELGLNKPRKLAELAGNPQNQLRFIHVAGTNGKGSTCAMLESIYRAAGLRAGLYTSPHFVSFRERIQVNRQLISESNVVRLVAEMRPWLKEFPADCHPTIFEVITVMALKYFAEQKCDLVILETGLGGRLDATNIITPLASVITNIGLDHQQWLGDTLEKIAAEKAGIIKPGVPVLTTVDQPPVLRVIERIAREQDAPRTRVYAPRTTHHASLPGAHQQLNAALAVATVEVLQNQIPVSAEAIRRGLETVHWPGRLQFVERPGGKKILLDGAHNVAGAEALEAMLRAGAPNSDSAQWDSFLKRADSEIGAPTLILGILADKDCQAMCDILAPLAARILLVPVGSERTAKPEDLAEKCRRANPRANGTVCDSLAEALARSERDSFVVITGSLSLVGEALEALGLSPEAGKGERALNEWGGAKHNDAPAERRPPGTARW